MHINSTGRHVGPRSMSTRATYQPVITITGRHAKPRRLAAPYTAYLLVIGSFTLAGVTIAAIGWVIR